MANIQSAPSLDSLTQYDVNRSGMVEAVKASLYDFQPYAQAGQTSLTFFQVPVGQSSKNLDDTNMVSAGQLPAPQNFLVQGIEIHFFPGVLPSIVGSQVTSDAVNDVWKVAKSGFLNFFIGSKSYLTEAPLMRFAPKNGLIVSSSLSMTATSGASGLAGIAYANFGGRPYDLNPPIVLRPTQNFNVSLNWSTAVSVSVAARIGVILTGILYRQSQ
jgi:hypothetical protein